MLPDTVVIQVTGTGPDRQVLADYLNATVSATITGTRDLFKVVVLQSLEAAIPPQDPVSPQPSRDIPLGIALGFLIGALLALALDYMRGALDTRLAERPATAASAGASPASAPGPATGPPGIPPVGVEEPRSRRGLLRPPFDSRKS